MAKPRFCQIPMTASTGSTVASSRSQLAVGKPTAANVLFNRYISDMETCFKLIPAPLYRDLDIKATGFGMDAEITGKLLRRGYRPYEVPISYKARTREAGKKLTWRDGVEALWILLRERFLPRRG